MSDETDPGHESAGNGDETDPGHESAGNDAARQAARELVRAARSFLDAAERTLDDDEAMARWAARGQDVVQGFLAGFSSAPADPEPPDDDGGIEHIPVD